jgi:hypothetical protein
MRAVRDGNQLFKLWCILTTTQSVAASWIQRVDASYDRPCVFVQVNTRTIRIVQSGTHHKAANTAESIDSNLGGHDENVQGNDDDEKGCCVELAPEDFVVFQSKDANWVWVQQLELQNRMAPSRDASVTPKIRYTTIIYFSDAHPEQ